MPRAILDAVRRKARRVLVGVDARGVDAMQRLLPGSYQRFVTTATRLLEKSSGGTQSCLF